MKGCGNKCMQITLIIFNLLFLLVGAALLYLGIRAYIYLWHILEGGFDDPLLRGAIVAVMVVGAFITVVSLFGCVGACCENACMLHTYAAIVALMLIIQLVGGILAAIYYTRIDSWLDEQMTYSVQHYHKRDSRSEALDTVQVWLKCCGQDGPEDWELNTTSMRNGTYWANDFPMSCCVLEAEDVTQINRENFMHNCQEGEEGSYHTQGCREALRAWMKTNALILTVVALSLLVVEIVVITLACCLKSALDRQKQVYA